MAERRDGSQHPEQSLDEADGDRGEGAAPRQHPEPDRVERAGAEHVSELFFFFKYTIDLIL